jgi:hypothetical protein
MVPVREIQGDCPFFGTKIILAIRINHLQAFRPAQRGSSAAIERMVGLGRKNPHKMANLKVALWRYVRSTRRDWHRVHVEPVRSGRGFTEDWDKPKTFGPDCVALGPWGLKWYGDKGKAIYQRLDSDLQESLNARDRKEKDLKADAADINAGRSPREEDITRETLVKRKEKFIQKKLDKKLDKESISAYEHLIGEFLEVTQRRYPEDVHSGFIHAEIMLAVPSIGPCRPKAMMAQDR